MFDSYCSVSEVQIQFLGNLASMRYGMYLGSIGSNESTRGVACAVSNWPVEPGICVSIMILNNYSLIHFLMGKHLFEDLHF